MTTACIPHLMVDTGKYNKPVLLIDILPDRASAGAQWVRTTLSGVTGVPRSPFLKVHVLRQHPLERWLGPSQCQPPGITLKHLLVPSGTVILNVQISSAYDLCCQQHDEATANVTLHSPPRESPSCQRSTLRTCPRTHRPA